MAEPVKKKPNLQLGIRFKERPKDPPPGLKWIKVKNKQTLGSIADEYGILPADLMLYNWHTINPAEVNWYLYHYVGARRHNGKFYYFSTSDNPGMLLVPDMPPRVKQGPRVSVDAVRNGTATLDSRLKIYIVERLATGEVVDVSGKWLYVFSGSGGVNFGYEPPPPLPRKIDRELPVAETDQPGSGFTLDFPGVFHIKEKPDKLEYEILITSKTEASPDLITAASGLKSAGKPYHKVGNNWYFLSDYAILKEATNKSRDSRTTHAFRGNSNNQLVPIDLSKNRRYYFLLSPVQLGPEALKYAMANPKGLTPLLKPGEHAKQWDPDKANDPHIPDYVGPSADDIKTGTVLLEVIDPYAWAESIVEKVHADDINQYIQWVTSRYNETVKDLKKTTGWTLEHYYVAQILKSVRESHPKPASIDKELQDPNKWREYLNKWEEELFQRNAEINANAHRSLVQLIEWLDGPGHGVIETALLKDTTADSPQDALDVARGILHWAVCTEYMMALEPGVLYLRDVLKRPGTVPNDVVLGHFKDLDKDAFTVNLTKTHQNAFRYGYQGVLMLMALQDFVTPAPPVPKSASRQEYLMRLADYNAKRRDNIIAFFNQFQILPGKIGMPDKTKLPPGPAQGSAWSPGSTAVNALLDLTDKWTTYVIDPEIKIPRNKGRILNSMANLEQWFDKRPTFAKWANQGSSYALKVGALGISSYNLYTTVATARYDYQHSVSATDWASVASGSTLAVQDVLAEVATLTKSAGMQRIFPQLMTTAGGPSWGVGAAQVTGIAGRVFAGVNVLAMLASGVMTMVSMGQSALKSYRRGDYTAAAFYGVGVLGGAMMATGAIFFGYALMQAGGAVSATGIGATVGVVLFAVGGIIAGIAALFGWLASSDDYQVFARKCFLGHHANKEPRFGSDPPEWTHATDKDGNSWPIENQKRAIFNLLGRFQVKTVPKNTFERNRVYTGSLNVEMTPALFMAGSTVELSLHYGNGGTPTSATIRWDQFAHGDKQRSSDKPVKITKGDLFDAGDTYAAYEYGGDALKKIHIRAFRLAYDGGKGALVTTVTLRYPDHPNTIRCRKLVMKHGTAYGVTVDDDEVTSDIYV